MIEWLDRVIDAYRAWKDFWLSPAGNNLLHLTIVMGLVFAWLFYMMYTRQQHILKARARIPLVIGGWGTRGKSGTERCKAAFLNGLGARYVSKSTGCEAMFVVGMDLSESVEYYLFRPHDKATIWEQKNVIDVADRLQADAMLWECMALQYDYVKILEQAWMHDDLSTLTNAYPDHEDIQGPAGRDVAYSIANFIPPKGIVVSTEESMIPIFRETARKRDTRLTMVDPDVGDLICPDVSDRVPYSEHSKNLAVAIHLGKFFGASSDFVLKEVADHIVPDLGAMKTYPELEVKGRWVKMSNGMSANERAGTIHNWRRLDLEDPKRNRREWIVCVINNRADRVPRSKVFASILADDLAYHQTFAIGSNLGGLKGYFENAVDVRINRLALPDGNPSEFLKNVFERDVLYLRFFCRTPEELGQRVSDTLGKSEGEFAAAAAGVSVVSVEALMEAFKALAPEGTEEEWRFVEKDVKHYVDMVEHKRSLDAAVSAGDRGALENWLAKHRVWYREKALGALFIVNDFYITGPNLIRLICSELPPRAHIHLIGIQNIKGTGLDFAERWLRIGNIDRALQKFLDGDPIQREQATKYVLNQNLIVDFEALHIRRRLEPLTSREEQQDALTRRLLGDLNAKIEADSAAGKGQAAVTQKKESWASALYRKIIGKLEIMLDPFDAIYRGSMAKRVMKDLAHQRISGPIAGELLKHFHFRQKGGWLEKLLSRKKAG